MNTHLTRRAVLARAVVAFGATAFGSLSPRPAAAHKTHVIEITRFKFAPAKLKASPGDTITWINRDIAPHTATAMDKSWDSGTVRRGESKSVQITEGFIDGYFCRFHPMMNAQLEIVPHD
jgi:plastocyanin